MGCDRKTRSSTAARSARSTPRSSAATIRKRPGRTEFQRGILSASDGGWTVCTTGDQGSGILSSMSQANCFIVLGADVGNVAAGELVDVQLLEGLI